MVCCVAVRLGLLVDAALENGFYDGGGAGTASVRIW
jgi:hypothetical protein